MDIIYRLEAINPSTGREHQMSFRDAAACERTAQDFRSRETRSGMGDITSWSVTVWRECACCGDVIADVAASAAD